MLSRPFTSGLALWALVLALWALGLALWALALALHIKYGSFEPAGVTTVPEHEESDARAIEEVDLPW